MTSTKGNIKCCIWLYPYQKETANHWWHRFAKVILILFLVIAPLYIWERVAVKEFNRCYSLYLIDWFKTGQEGFMVPLSTKAELYSEAKQGYADCAAQAKADGLAAVIIGDLFLFAVLNFLYYRILLYIHFGSPKN